MNTTPRLGLLTPGWPGQNTPNGIATSVYSLAIGLHQIGQTPVIIAMNIDGPCPADIPVVAVKDMAWRLQDRIRAKLGDTDVPHRHIARTIAHATKQAITDHRLNVLIMEETNGWAGFVQKDVSVPVLITLHGPWVLHRQIETRGDLKKDQQRESREQRAYEAAPALIAPSQNALRAVTESAQVGDIPRIVVPNSFFADDTATSASVCPPHNILFVGRFDVIKGGDIVLAAFEELFRTHPQARLTFVGPDRGIYQDDASMLSLDTALANLPAATRDAIDNKGPCDRDTIVALRKEHAVALIASRYENLNYTLLEAMSAGQAIVSTAVGGLGEVLDHEQTALMVPPDDPSAMAGALARLIDDPALTQSLGAAAHTELIQKYDPQVIAQQTVDFIQDAHVHKAS